ncbi:MAG: hypothetical protein ACK2TU_00990 [Anaerolineales bacterium]
MQVTVNRNNTPFKPDASRVIARFQYTDDIRSKKLIQDLLRLSDSEALFVLNQTLRDYSMRHRNISKIFEKHFNKVVHLLSQLGIEPETISNTRKILIGSYFTMEYSIESTAFFNPSIVEHPDQTETGPGELRVILSFRATGEGHISSIVFRTGILDMHNNLILEPVGSMLEEAEHIRRHIYNKESFSHKLDEMQDVKGIIPPNLILDKLNDEFTYGELRQCIEEARKAHHLVSDKELLFNQIIWLASSHYELQFSLDTNISERVIFPVSSNEKNVLRRKIFLL